MTDPREILSTHSSYALVGASADSEKYSFQLLETLRQAGYTVYPVNPRYTDIDGLLCYPSLAALPERPDVTICALAPHNTERVVGQVAEQRIAVLWLPPECGSDAAVADAQGLGLTVVHDLCPIGLLARMQAEREVNGKE